MKPVVKDGQSSRPSVEAARIERSSFVQRGEDPAIE